MFSLIAPEWPAVKSALAIRIPHARMIANAGEPARCWPTRSAGRSGHRGAARSDLTVGMGSSTDTERVGAVPR